MLDRLTTIEDALSIVLAQATPLQAVRCPLAQSLGLVLAEDIIASHSIPPFDHSAMDGYALLASDTHGATADRPVSLRLTETIAAGHCAKHAVSSGEAARIMTGAPLPRGADAVVQLESTEEVDGCVLILAPARPGDNTRVAGGDVAAGTKALESGTLLGPAEIGLAASLGLVTLPVHARPTVSIVSTGSELVEVGRSLGPGQIHDSNRYSLLALCQQLGIEADVLGTPVDDCKATVELLARGLEYDVLVTSGGVSVGAFDFVKEAQAELGVERLLWGVAMKPGKPLVFGKRGKTLVFGLPGNPVSAMVSFELFVRPALLRLMGHRRTERPVYKATMAEGLDALEERVNVVRVKVRREGAKLRATSTGDQGSGRLRSMAGANGLVFVPAASAGFKAGDEVDVTLLSDPLDER